MKRQVPLVITFFVGALLIVSIFSPATENLGEDFSVFFDVIAVFAFFLGGGNLLRVHLTKISRKREDWIYSIVTLVGFVLMLWAGLFKVWNEGGIAASVTEENSLFGMVFYSVLIPLQSTMYSLLAFFIASASYRAFRAKNREATILLVAAFIILLGRTAFGTMLTSWMPPSLSLAEIPNLAIWIMNAPNLAGQRAIMIGIGLGVVSMSLRIILGVERTYLGDDGK